MHKPDNQTTLTPMTDSHTLSWDNPLLISHNSVYFTVLTKLVASKRGPLCRILPWGGIELKQSSLWTDSRPPEEAAHVPWNSCFQHSASVPAKTHKGIRNWKNTWWSRFESRVEICSSNVQKLRPEGEAFALDDQRFSPEGDTCLYLIDPSWHTVWCVPAVLLIGPEGT